MKIKRLIYFGYYLVNLDWKKYRLFLNYVSKNNNLKKTFLIANSIIDVFKYNISILEYFQFHFYKKSHKEKNTYAGTGFMYESMLKLNPKKSRYILADKSVFLKKYKDFVNHDFISINELNNDSFKKISQFKSGKLVLKNSKGQCGRGIDIIENKISTVEELVKRMGEYNNDLIEEFVQQHDDLNRLSPAGLNTLRIITQINKDNEVDILGIRLRITVNSKVDNLAAGNIAAAVDEKTGIVTGPGVYSDITKKDEYFHPVTNEKIIGFKIPFFKESVDLAKKAAKLDTRNRSIGWDVAITNDGPELIEGNHDWCKLLWQLPVKRGLKHVLEDYVKGIK